MKWKWITLLCILKNVSTLDPPNDLWKPIQPSSISSKSKSNLSRVRPKNPRIASQSTQSVLPQELTNLRENLETNFLDVIYPTSILDAAQPFYYSPPGYDSVLGPFSNDVKSSYKTISSEKVKSPITPDYSFSLKQQEKYIEDVLMDFEINDIFLNESLQFESEMQNHTKESNEDEHEERSKITCEETICHKNNETSTRTSLFYNSGKSNHESMSYEISDSNIDELHVDILQKNIVTLDPHYSNKTYYVDITPNYVDFTNITGGSPEDFVSDIMNIYSLIEETIRAISVVEFVVSKTLGALVSEEKHNETITFQEINSNFTTENKKNSHGENFTISYKNDYYITENSSIQYQNISSENLLDECDIECSALTSGIISTDTALTLLQKFPCTLDIEGNSLVFDLNSEKNNTCVYSKDACQDCQTERDIVTNASDIANNDLLENTNHDIIKDRSESEEHYTTNEYSTTKSDEESEENFNITCVNTIELNYSMSDSKSEEIITDLYSNDAPTGAKLDEEPEENYKITYLIGNNDQNYLLPDYKSKDNITD